MMKDSIKIQFVLIILLIIFLILPYKSYINKRVYDSQANYQIFKKINRSNITIYGSIIVLYDKEDNMDFYHYGNGYLDYVRNFEKIIHFETYEKDLMYHEEDYNLYTFISKNNKLKFYNGNLTEELLINNYKEFLNVRLFDNELIHIKKIKPFVMKLQTPKEFYNNFKEFFSPYYLGEYELK